MGITVSASRYWPNEEISLPSGSDSDREDFLGTSIQTRQNNDIGEVDEHLVLHAHTTTRVAKSVYRPGEHPSSGIRGHWIQMREI